MSRRQKGLTYLVVGPFAIVLAFPFYLALVTMFKTNADLSIVEHSPYVVNDAEGTFHWDFWNYATTEHVAFLFNDTNYPTWLLNTLLVGAAVVAITLLLAMPAGYALARLSGPWGQSAGVAIFLVYLIPPTLLFLPLSRIITNLDLKDSLWSLILVYPSFTIPFATWLLMGFFKTIPQELEDAALVDGCSRLRALFRIVLPISLPGILTVVIFAFLHLLVGAANGLGGHPQRPHSRRCLLLAVAACCNAHPSDTSRASLQRLPRPLHQGFHGRRIPVKHPL
jgi:multiple sugar transport system permease protein